MTLIHTEQMDPSRLSESENLQAYCGLDCCVTLEVHEELARLFSPFPQIYDFERALQAPYLEIMQRGFLVDELGRKAASAALRERIITMRQMLNEFAIAVWGKGINANSPQQLKTFFYGQEGLGLPEQWISIKGERKLSTNREVLEKLEIYMYARPIIALVLSIRDLEKQDEIFTCDIDADGRFRAGYNIAGTETGEGHHPLRMLSVQDATRKTLPQTYDSRSYQISAGRWPLLTSNKSKPVMLGTFVECYSTIGHTLTLVSLETCIQTMRNVFGLSCNGAITPDKIDRSRIKISTANSATGIWLNAEVTCPITWAPPGLHREH